MTGYPQAHITAGDLSPVTFRQETDYATPTGDPAYYADIAEGGKFTMQDSNNPYVAYRYGNRSFDPDDYVTRQMDAAFSATLEVRDALGWQRIIEYATGMGGTAPYGSLPSREEAIYVRTGASEWQGRVYTGCKTDSLTISADAPGGIVKFEENVLASEGNDDDLMTAISAWVSSVPAVQWLSGMEVGGVPVYPQSFSITINNALARSYKPKEGGAVTGALQEGRREIAFECECWMEDLAYIRSSMANGDPGSIMLTLGISAPVRILLTGVRWMADGTYPDLVQDKQRDKLRFRATGITLTPISVTPPE